MYDEELVFGLVGSSPAGQGSAVARKLRDLTISWSRYDYRGRILEASTVEGVLDEAVDEGYRWCLLQRPGNVILERWRGDPEHARFDQCVAKWIGERDFLALGNDDWLLVDVRRWEELGRPEVSGAFVDDEHCVSLARADQRILGRYLGDDIRTFSTDEAALDPRVAAFLQEVQQQVLNGPRGVFLWNLEPYDDVMTPPRGFEAPVSTLYSVASGFKPNAILESLGFDDATRVVFFDCSANALEVKRLLLEEWDGRDFPAFVADLFRKLPSHAAHYHLWDGHTPETLDAHALEWAWQHELELWGGARAFEEHWSRYRRLRHEFVRCDVLADVAELLARVELEQSAVIWWSNAFFSVWGNWLLDGVSRKRLYERFVEALAERNPDLFLYGSDFTNSSVNDIRAAEYRDLLCETECDELTPLAANAYEIRF
jgi:hypothetical protein